MLKTVAQFTTKINESRETRISASDCLKVRVKNRGSLPIYVNGDIIGPGEAETYDAGPGNVFFEDFEINLADSGTAIEIYVTRYFYKDKC